MDQQRRARTAGAAWQRRARVDGIEAHIEAEGDVSRDEPPRAAAVVDGLEALTVGRLRRLAVRTIDQVQVPMPPLR